MNRRKRVNVALTVVILLGILGCILGLWHQAQVNKRENAEQDRVISSLVVQREEAKDGAAAAVDTAEAANDKLEASGQAPVPIPSKAVEAAQGARGATGASGAAGRDGAPGAPGRDGIDGADGEPGADGSDGQRGAQGQSGAASTVPGPAGADGAPGPAGQDGKDGQDGADSTVPGPAGPQGEKGDPGEPGTPGTNGRDGSNGEPPVSWTFTDSMGTSYNCQRVTPFDSAAPSYSCAADGGAVLPDPIESENPDGP